MQPDLILGRPVRDALNALPAGAPRPTVLETAAPLRPGQERRDGTARVVAVRGNVWIAARFWDGPPRKKEEP